MASHLSHLMAIDRPNSRVSLARSDTTCYHSFQDVDLHEPEAPSRQSQNVTTCPPPVSATPKEEQRPGAREMRRQDSGYESILAPRDSVSGHKAASSTTSLSSSTRKRRTKPSAKRSSMSGPAPHRPRNSRHSVSPSGSSRSPSSQPQQPVTYFHFPHFTSSDPALVEPEPASDLHSPSNTDLGSAPSCALRSETPAAYPPPPQTTHYWTSDRTRRLEYAAIDAASKGVRGWVFRHVVPDCFIPQSKRRIGFEDDRGSVVRYRLDLDGEEGADKAESVRGKGWKEWWGRRR